MGINDSDPCMDAGYQGNAGAVAEGSFAIAQDDIFNLITVYQFQDTGFTEPGISSALKFSFNV